MSTVVTGERRALGPRQVTFLVALAVFAQESMWNFYDNQVPPMLRDHLSSAALVGFVHGHGQPARHLHPAVDRQPVRPHPHRSGVAGSPISPSGCRPPRCSSSSCHTRRSSLPLLIVVIVAFALVSNSFKPIGEALVPDFIAPERRGRANAG